jgi:hypothetical protein
MRPPTSGARADTRHRTRYFTHLHFGCHHLYRRRLETGEGRAGLGLAVIIETEQAAEQQEQNSGGQD